MTTLDYSFTFVARPAYTIGVYSRSGMMKAWLDREFLRCYRNIIIILHKTVSSRVIKMSYIFEPFVPKFGSISLLKNSTLTFRALATFDDPLSVNITVPSTLAHLECPQSSPSRPILIRLPFVASTSTNFGRLSRKNRFYTRAQLVVFGRDVSSGHLNFSCGRDLWILWTSGSLGSVFTRGYLNLMSSCFSGGTVGDERSWACRL